VAENLAAGEPLVAPAEAPQPGEPAVRPEEPRTLVRRPPEGSGVRRRAYRGRFGVAYLALALVAAAAAAGTVLLLDRPDRPDEGIWSNWRPTGDEDTYVSQIADYVSGRYRQPSGNPLVAILSGRPQVQTGEEPLPLQAVAIQGNPQGEDDDIDVVRIDKGIMYTLCGLGQQCSMAEGQPSQERHRLLRREALELALYTFKYTDRRSVLALLPPRIGPGEDGEPQVVAATALFFQQKDLEEALDRPLRRTLLSANPPRAAEIGREEESIIDRLTTPRLFQYQFTQTQQGAAIVVLAPVTR
jgi:hypothetical protein